jgi:hypothetical protein
LRAHMGVFVRQEAADDGAQALAQAADLALLG